jgi:hypothetical protein
MKRYRFHPICLLFPQMSREELLALANDSPAADTATATPRTRRTEPA